MNKVQCLYENKRYNFMYLFSFLTMICFSAAQCPWRKDIADLDTFCVCAYNLGHQISVQCDQVNFSTLINTLNLYFINKPIDLLYINNSTIQDLKNDVFENFQIYNLQLSNCEIQNIGKSAFKGQEMYLRNLNLQNNLLETVPTTALKSLSSLNLLDLSKNQIKLIPENAFYGLIKLSTLKLNDNNLILSSKAFKGLENSLKNLNLKSTRQKEVPNSIRGLKTLAFLDLSQNSIKELPGNDGVHTFEGLVSLSALNLERNLIQTLGETSFTGIRKTLSSLSLLNNLLAEFPVGAIHALKELRVLDIGFNLLTRLPDISFRGNPNIALLALDGNPLRTVPEKSFKHLNNTLRGLSLGGRFLHCDCKLKWIAEWIHGGELQVTSRERNPQFCGSPNKFRDRGFYSIQPEELTCNNSEINTDVPIGLIDSLIPNKSSTARPNIKNNTHKTVPMTANIKYSTEHATISKKTEMDIKFAEIINTINTSINPIITDTTPMPTSFIISTNNKNSENNNLNVKNQNLWRQNSSYNKVSRPSLVMGFPHQHNSKFDNTVELQIKNAFRQDNSIIIQWESDITNILGFRVVYRLFGEKIFKQGPPLESNEREFKIKSVPSQECIIVCVITLEDLRITPENIPYSQCREVRTLSSQSSNMDKITIAASAAICGTIIVAVIVFIAASRRSKKLHSLYSQQKSPLPITSIPVNCCGQTSPMPLGSIAALSALSNKKDWDQNSTYSNKSIPRPRICSIENKGAIDNLRNHAPHFSSAHKVSDARSVADGQSQHSFSNKCHRGYLGAAFPTNLVDSRPELRQSRQSLGSASDRLTHASYSGSVHGPTSITSSTRRSRPRSRSKEYIHNIHMHHHRPSSRYSMTGSTHTLNNYCDTSDNWTDHDMDIYMARNAITRNGLVPL